MISEKCDQLPTHELLRLARASADDSRDPEARWAFVSALHRRPEPGVFGQAAAWCRAALASERELGADILGQLGAGAQERPWPLASESTPILVRLLHDSCDRVAAAALIGLGHLRAGEPAELVRLASHPSADVRHAVAFALGGRPDAVSLDTLVALCGDDALEVRNWATFGLGTLGDADTPAIRDALMKRLADADPEVRGEAMVGLARRGDERAGSAILAELHGEEVLCLAVEAAEYSPSSAFVPHLERLLARHPDDTQIQAAVHRCRAAPQA